MEEQFWLKDPASLLKSLCIIPSGNISFERQLNCLTRLTLVVSGTLLICGKKEWMWVLVGGISIVLIAYFIYKEQKNIGITIDTNNPSGQLKDKSKTAGVNMPNNICAIGEDGTCGCNSCGSTCNGPSGSPFINPRCETNLSNSMAMTGGVVEPQYNMEFYEPLAEPHCPYDATTCQFFKRVLKPGQTPCGRPEQEYACNSPYPTSQAESICPTVEEDASDPDYKQQYISPIGGNNESSSCNCDVTGAYQDGSNSMYSEYNQPPNFQSEIEQETTDLMSCKLSADSKFIQDQNRFRNDMIRGFKARKNREVRKLPLHQIKQF